MKKLLRKAEIWVNFQYYYLRFNLCKSDSFKKDYFRRIAKEYLYMM